MRIAIFTNNYLPRVSGVAIAVHFLERALRELGHKTLVIAPDYSLEEEQVKDTEVMRITSFSFPNLKFAIPLEFIDRGLIEDKVTEFNPDLIHTHHPFLLGKSALDMADQLDVPLVYTFHTLYEFFTHYFLMDTEQVRKQVREYLVNFSNCCDLVVAPTEPIRQYLVELGVSTKTASIPTGIDFERFEKVQEHSLARRRKKLKLDRFDRVMFYAGRISREKNLSLAFQALKILTDEGLNLCLMLAGDGPAKRPYQKEIAKLGIDERVIWLGFRPQHELPEFYFLSDLFLFPSASDTQGIVLYEARAAEIPIVAVESMASKAIVQDGKNGRFAKADPADFARKIKEVLENPARFKVPFERELYSKSSIGKKYQELYQELIKQGRSRKRRQLGTIFFPFFNP
jgi:glycosyltransferase involved in cell wall biosynthesis